MVDVDDELLLKRSKLSPDETRQVRRSPIYSVKRILRARQLNKLMNKYGIRKEEFKSP